MLFTKTWAYYTTVDFYFLVKSHIKKVGEKSLKMVTFKIVEIVSIHDF